MVKIFLCHANEDKPQVREIYQRLKAEGFEPWLDEEDLLPGQLWDQEIQQVMRESDSLLIFFSHNSVAKRGYVQREFKFALDAWEERPTDTIHTIPIRLDDCEIPKEFHKFHSCDLYKDQGFCKLIQALHKLHEISSQDKVIEDSLSELRKQQDESEKYLNIDSMMSEKIKHIGTQLDIKDATIDKLSNDLEDAQDVIERIRERREKISHEIRIIDSADPYNDQYWVLPRPIVYAVSQLEDSLRQDVMKRPEKAQEFLEVMRATLTTLYGKQRNLY